MKILTPSIIKFFLFLLFVSSGFFMSEERAEAAASCGTPLHAIPNACDTGYLGYTGFDSVNPSCYHWYCDSVSGSNDNASGLCYACPSNPSISSFYAYPYDVPASGGGEGLYWSSSDDDRCELAGMEDAVVLGPSFGIPVPTSVSYGYGVGFVLPGKQFGLECYNDTWGTYTTQWLTIQETPPPPPPPPPSVPTNVKGNPGACGGKVDLSWDASANAVSYNIYTSGLFGSLVGNTTDKKFTVQVQKSIFGIYFPHSYYIKAKNSAGVESDGSLSTGLITPSGDCVAPTCTGVTFPACITPGTNFTVSVNGTSDTTEVRFPTWSTDNGQDDINWYLDTTSLFSMSIPQSSHTGGTGEINTHVYLYNPAFPTGLYCGGQAIPLCATTASDLRSQSLTTPAIAVKGTAITSITSVVANIGTANAGAFSDNFTYRFGTSGAWTPITSVSHAGGLTNIIGTNWMTDTLSSFTPPSTGTLYIQHCVDSTGAIAESDETNNCTIANSGAGITVNPPVSPPVTTCTTKVIDYCRVVPSIEGGFSGTCEDSEGVCLYKCMADDTWVISGDNTCKVKLTPPKITAPAYGDHNRIMVPYGTDVLLNFDLNEGINCTFTKASLSHPDPATSIPSAIANLSYTAHVTANSIYTLMCNTLKSTLIIEVLSGGFET